MNKTIVSLTPLLLSSLVACAFDSAEDSELTSAPESERVGQQQEALQASATDDPNEVEWVHERNLNSQQFGASFTRLRAAGYRIIDVNVVDGIYASVWRKSDGKAWASYRDMTSEEYGTRWQSMKDDGYRPLDIDAYQRNGALAFAGIWVKNDDGLAWASFRNLTEADFSAKFTQYRDGGYMPTDVEAYQIGDEWRYAVIWVKNSSNYGWALHRNMTAEQYAARWEQYRDAGMRPIDIDSFQTGAGQRYLGIWLENKNGRDWSSYRDMTEATFANKVRAYTDDGYRLVDYERYQTSNGARYAGIWRQNGNPLSWSKRSAVDQAIKDYATKTNLPGLSVAIAQNGRIVFRQGYGFQDVAGGELAHGDTVYDAASVSKPIGATLLMRLRGAAPAAYNLDAATGSIVTGLPSHHTHTLRQLLTHSGCVRHYSNAVDTNPSVIPEVQYASQRAASATFWSDALICTPPSATARYSTHAFTFLGAAIEAIEGQTLPTLLRDELALPFDLRSLRVTFPLDNNDERAIMYTLQDTSKAPSASTNKNVVRTRTNTSWKTLGGGLELSAVDLARFGVGVRNASIVNAAARDAMWTASVGSRGLGWVVNSSFVSHDGSADGARSYLRVYTGATDNVVIAIMSNRRNHHTDGTDIPDLANAIDAAM
jgi:CubicO group peptidase (beta-lactamase class C family)